MEWQKVLEILTCKSKSTFLLQKNIKQENEIMIHLWNDQNIKKLIYLWLEDHYNKKEFKSITKAQSFKIIGNKEFQAKNYMKSVESYTKCALYAPMNSCELPIAIANRSASLFYLNRYDDCIKDIELSIKLNYPKQLHYKLYLRAIQCYLKLGKHHLAKETLSKIQQLIHDPNYIKPSMRDNIEKKICNITFIESCVQDIVTCHHHHNTNDILKLKSQIIFEENTNFPNASITIDRIHNEKLGRHVVANKFIKEGDILFLEEPISFVLLNHDTYSFCQYCNNLNTDIPVPCRTCLNTFYCNENCLTKAWSLYHCWECPGNQMNLWKEIGIGHLALKVLLTCSTITDKIKFNEMQNLVTNFDKLSMDDLTIYGITAIMLTIYLFKYTNFFKINNFENSLMKKFLDNFFNLNFNILTNNDKQLYISSLLLRYILQLISNGHAITKSNIFLSKNDSSMIQQDIVATGIYPSASIMNHSCDPNIINIFVNQYLIVRASRDISQGEEIFNCYGPHYRHMTTENRQKILKSQYCFICKPEKALDKLEKCLHIRRTVLYKYNEDITITLNLMAEIYKIMGQWINSIMCLENTLAAIKEKFGSFSIELLNQLNNLTDMCFKYLEKELNTKNTNTHKKIIKKTQIFLNQIEEITNLNYGFWSNIYKDVKKKQNQFLNYSTYNLNK
ncbi:SET and MYND domain-containing protein 4-like isoform X3 [Apis laboriosa]|uniref:SET and MYND domain-containing protein 4-like isoform X3 n=1 Tax=Apis laboriosa TaxID=183418 RepID=UPI001CC5187F|nr:SET and MYND domain-containing protein 4-like isoform X3 [Apis laboriosa]